MLLNKTLFFYHCGKKRDRSFITIKTKMKEYKIKNKIFIIILFIISFSLYYNVIHTKLFFDDEYFIVRNEFVQNFNIKEILTSQAYSGAGIAGSFYRPFQFIIHSIIYQFFGINPIPYHIISILFHTLVAVLIYLLVIDFKLSNTTAIFSSLLFLVHPIATQAVSYVSGLGDPMSLFFILLAILIYRKKDFFNYKLIPLILFSISIILAFLSKERSGVFILLLILIDLAFYKSQKNNNKKELFQFIKKDNISYYISSFILTVTYFFLRLFYLNFGEFSVKSSVTLYQRLITFIYVLGDYIKIIVYPHTLYLERPIVIFSSLLNLRIIITLMALLLIIFLAIKNYNSNKILLFSFFWFMITLLPSSGIIPLSYTIKEHWIYFSMVGFCIGFVYYWFKFITNKKIAIALLILIIFALSIRTYHRNQEWSDAKLFFENELRHNPQSDNGIANLAYEYYLDGNINKAIELYSKGVKLKDSHQLAMMNYDLGYMYHLKNNDDLAIKLYHKSLEIDPYYIYALQELAKYYYYKKDYNNYDIYKNRLLQLSKHIN